MWKKFFLTDDFTEHIYQNGFKTFYGIYFPVIISNSLFFTMYFAPERIVDQLTVNHFVK